MTSQTSISTSWQSIAISFDERDVHVAERVLQQLRELRGPARARPAPPCPRAARRTASRRPWTRGSCRPTTLRHVAERELLVAGVDALGRVGQQEVASGRPAPRSPGSAGRAPRSSPGTSSTPGSRAWRGERCSATSRQACLDVREVGRVVAQRRRHADEDDVAPIDRSELGREREPSRRERVPEVLLRHAGNREHVPDEVVDARAADVDPNRREPRLRRRAGDVEPDVALPKDGDRASRDRIRRRRRAVSFMAFLSSRRGVRVSGGPIGLSELDDLADRGGSAAETLST